VLYRMWAEGLRQITSKVGGGPAGKLVPASPRWDLCMGQQDAKVAWAMTKRGTIIAEFDGVPIGCITAVPMGTGHGHIGYWMVKATHRTVGVGTRLWDAAMQLLEARALVVHAIPWQVPWFEERGFMATYSVSRYHLQDAAHLHPLCGEAGRGLAMYPSLYGSVPERYTLRPVEDSDLTAVGEYDACATKLPKEWLALWLMREGAQAVLALDESQGGAVVGYGVLGRTRRGHRISPLLADTPLLATQILAKLSRTVEGEVWLDVPSRHRAAVALAEECGMQKGLTTIRMQNCDAPLGQEDQVYGVVSLEIGG